MVLVGNKCDVETNRQISTCAGLAIAEKYGIPFVETSVKFGLNVAEVFELLVAEWHRKVQK